MPERPCSESEAVEWVKGVTSRVCPVTYSREFGMVVFSVEQAKKNHLPHSGGWADQPAVLMELMNAYG